MIWAPVWSPYGSRIAYVDDRARLQVLEVAGGRITTADRGSQPGDRGAMAPRWSPDSKWLAYSKAFPNNFRRVMVWSLADGRARAITDALANAESPAWDRNGKWLYLLASTDLGVRSGWADLGSVTRTSTSAPYVVVLRADEPTPFVPESDEEAAARAQAATQPPGAPGAPGTTLPSAPAAAARRRPRCASTSTASTAASSRC